ncbi:DHCW motif cupin fold protein [soil metagenome]
MKLPPHPFEVDDWATIESTTHPGETGTATWRTRHLGDVRVRLVEYSAGYVADHWCTKGHVLTCLDGELVTELDDGRSFTLRPGMTYRVGDDSEPHRSHTETGAVLLIVD